MDPEQHSQDSSRSSPPPARAKASADSNLRTPALAFIAVCLGVFAIETLVMWNLEPMLFLGERIEAVVDAATLLVVMAPLLYFLFVRPMARVIHEKTQAERALTVACEDLESKVQVRTSELENANKTLQEEIRQRVRTMARLQIQGKLLDSVQQAVLATGADGNVIYWNQFAEEMFGWSHEEARGRLLADLALFPAKLLTEELSDPATARAWDGEVPAMRRGGLAFPAYLTCSPMWRPDCSVGGFVYTFIDISDRKDAEEAIRQSEEKYSTVVESSPTGIFIFQDEKLVFANRRFFELLALVPENLDNLRPQTFIHPEDWPVVEAIWQKRFLGEEAGKDYEYRILTARGGLRWFSGRSNLIRIRGQKALLVNIQDVTEHHEAVTALRDSQEILQRLSACQITAQEDERRRVARELHDGLGQSLSAIKFIVERALENGSAKDPAGSLATIRTVIPVIQSTMEEVRRISMALRPSTLDDLGLLMTIAWFTREFQTTYPDIRIEKAIEVEEAQVPETLKTNIFRILQEAMSNAAKHSQTDRIRVSLKLSEERLELRIQDEGIGFDTKHKKLADLQGGLGLDSMRERAILFGGICTITSVPGEGTTVTARWTLEASTLARQS